MWRCKRSLSISKSIKVIVKIILDLKSKVEFLKKKGNNDQKHDMENILDKQKAIAESAAAITVIDKEIKCSNKRTERHYLGAKIADFCVRKTNARNVWRQIDILGYANGKIADMDVKGEMNASISMLLLPMMKETLKHTKMVWKTVSTIVLDANAYSQTSSVW